MLDLTTKKNIGVGEVAEATTGSCARNLLALFNDTIRPAYGKCGKATESEMVAAAELANVHKSVVYYRLASTHLVGMSTSFLCTIRYWYEQT